MPLSATATKATLRLAGRDAAQLDSCALTKAEDGTWQIRGHIITGTEDMTLLDAESDRWELRVHMATRTWRFRPCHVEGTGSLFITADNDPDIME